LPIFLGADLNQRPILLLMMSSSLKRTPRVDLKLSKKFKDVHRILYHLFPDTKIKRTYQVLNPLFQSYQSVVWLDFALSDKTELL
jgi:hypothetical protein